MKYVRLLETCQFTLYNGITFIFIVQFIQLFIWSHGKFFNIPKTTFCQETTYILVKLDTVTT